MPKLKKKMKFKKVYAKMLIFLPPHPPPPSVYFVHFGKLLTTIDDPLQANSEFRHFEKYLNILGIL